MKVSAMAEVVACNASSGLVHPDCSQLPRGAHTIPEYLGRFRVQTAANGPQGSGSEAIAHGEAFATPNGIWQPW